MFPRQPCWWLPAALAFGVAGLLGGCAGPQEAYAVVHRARPRPAPQGEKTVLSVETPDGGVQRFTLRQLQALRAVRYQARQPQLGRSFDYQGVLLSDLARETGLSGRDLRFEALDGFGATVRAQDYAAYPVMLAYQADGAPISIAQKGPLTVIFPNKAYPNRFPQIRYGPQWVWYVNRVRPR